MDVEIHQVPGDLSLSAQQIKNITINTCNELNLSALSITFIFVTDEKLAEMHGTYLQDNSKTDVITFNLGDKDIEGEIYISKDRAFEQAKQYEVSFEEEIIRLVIHGILHLAGYDDIEEQDGKEMKKIENSLLVKMQEYNKD